MKTINTTALVALLSSVKGATICTVEAHTEPKMNKRGNTLYGRVTKIFRGQLQFGYNYENAVNNRLEKVGSDTDFVASSRPFGKWVIPNKVAEHNGQIYLRFYTMNGNKGEVSYLVDGRPATAEELDIIKFFTPERKPSTKQSQHGLSEHQVQPTEYKAQAIRKIAVNGETYAVQAEQVEVELAVAAK